MRTHRGWITGMNPVMRGKGEPSGPSTLTLTVIQRRERRNTLFNATSPIYASLMKGYVYILASRRNGTLYTGVTRDLSTRLFEHQNEILPGFTSRYGVKRLVWFEEHDLLVAAIQREKNIKKYPRKWKLNLIEAMNPDWDDISHYLHGL